MIWRWVFCKKKELKRIKRRSVRWKSAQSRLCLLWTKFSWFGFGGCEVTSLSVCRVPTVSQRATTPPLMSDHWGAVFPSSHIELNITHTHLILLDWLNKCSHNINLMFAQQSKLYASGTWATCVTVFSPVRVCPGGLPPSALSFNSHTPSSGQHVPLMCHRSAKNESDVLV